mmetsp:Transcript_178749/g.572916  ORF Transcript_178749/g.572916 Transcript_178749/m.572916 type:complete len:155 (-) Transcript_178749:439-903(-)
MSWNPMSHVPSLRRPSATSQCKDSINRRRMTPEEKMLQIKHGCDKAPWADSEYKDDLQKQLLQSYRWSGSFSRDFCFFICNWHPFLGMFWSHPMHPWSKRERRRFLDQPHFREMVVVMLLLSRRHLQCAFVCCSLRQVCVRLLHGDVRARDAVG